MAKVDMITLVETLRALQACREHFNRIGDELQIGECNHMISLIHLKGDADDFLPSDLHAIADYLSDFASHLNEKGTARFVARSMRQTASDLRDAAGGDDKESV